MNNNLSNENRQALLAAYKNAFKSRYLDKQLCVLSAERTITRTLASGIGTEVGPSIIGALLKKEDFLIPRYRGYAAIIGKGISSDSIVSELFETMNGPSKGIGDLSPFHDAENRIVGPSLALGTMFGVAIGLGLSLARKRTEQRIVVHYFGDGEASRTTFGAALNLAALWKLPILFVCENDGISMATELKETSATETIAERAAGYGIKAKTMPDDNAFLFYKSAEEYIGYVRNESKPFLLEIKQHRQAPHSTSDSTLFPPPSHTADPLGLFKDNLLNSGISNKDIETIEQNAIHEISEAVRKAGKERKISTEELYAIFSNN